MTITAGDLVFWIRGDSSKLPGDLAKATTMVQAAGDQMVGYIKNNIGTVLTNVGGELKSLGMMMTVGVTMPIVAGLTMATKAASDFNETVNVTGLMFVENKEAMIKWADEAARTLGMGRNTALGTLNTFAGLFSMLGKTEEETVVLSQQFVQLAADIGSAYNIPVQQAVYKLRAGLIGETEPLRAINVLINESAVSAKAAAMGLEMMNGKYTEAAKVEARMALILEQTSKVQGDFANTSGEMANASKITAAEIENLSITLGENLRPVMKFVLEQLNNFLAMINDLSPFQQKMIFGFLLIAAAAGPFIFAIGSIIGFFGDLILMWPVLTAFFSSLGVALPAIGTAFAGIGTAITGAVASLGAVLIPVGLLIASLILLGFVIWKYGAQAWESFKQLGFIVGFYVDKVIGYFGSLIKNLTKFAFEMVLVAMLWMEEFGRGFAEGWNNFWQWLWKTLTGLYDRLVEFGDQQFKNIGMNMVYGIGEGIASAWNWLTTTVSKLLDDLVKSARVRLMIESPSQVFADKIGKPSAQGIAAGFLEEMPTTMKKIDSSVVPEQKSARGVTVGHIEYHGAFSQEELNRLSDRSKSIAISTIAEALG